MIFTRALLHIGSLLVIAGGAAASDVFGSGHPFLDWSRSIDTLPGFLSCVFASFTTSYQNIRFCDDYRAFWFRSVRMMIVAYGVLLAIALFALHPISAISLLFPLIVFVASPVRWAVVRWIGPDAADRVLILGTGPLATKIAGALREGKDPNRVLVGMLSDDAATVSSAAGTVVGTIDDIERIIRELSPDRIIVALTERRGRMPVNALLKSRLRGIIVESGVRAYERMHGKLAIESLQPSYLVFEEGLKPSRTNAIVKRAISVFVGAVGFVVSLPLMAVIAVLVRLESDGPVLFRQERIGLNGRRFTLTKFRSMRNDGNTASQWAADNVERVTRLGYWLRKSHLDELPQFLNVLRGDMDLVGPRPHPVSNYELFEREIPYYCLRSMVRPGLTGWAQIRLGYANGLVEETEKMRYDLFYIKNQTPWMDLGIVLETIRIVVFGRIDPSEESIVAVPIASPAAAPVAPPDAGLNAA